MFFIAILDKAGIQIPSVNGGSVSVAGGWDGEGHREKRNRN